MSDNDHDKLCEHCEQIRLQAYILVSLTFQNQSIPDVMQTLAVIYSGMKYQYIEKGREQEFNDMWNDMTKLEFEQIALRNPMEPKKFDDGFDFRQHIKTNDKT